ncbi:MAG TPA: hypothetical protein VGD24_08735 [Gallionella sp.]
MALLLVALLLVLSGGLYILTRDRRYSKFALQLVRFSGLFLAVFLVLLLLERYVLTGWRFLG